MTDPHALLEAYTRTYPMNKAAHELAAALRAVLDIHTPFTLTTSRWTPKPVGCESCSVIPEFINYPCPTVRAIVDTLEAS